MSNISDLIPFEHVNSRIVMTYRDMNTKTGNIINKYLYYNSIGHSLSLFLIIIFLEISHSSEEDKQPTLPILIVQILTGLICFFTSKMANFIF